MTRLERNKLSIEGYCSNKLARYTCIARSLSVSDNMTRLERKKLPIEGRNLRNYQSTDTATTNKPDIHVYLVPFKRERQYDPFRTKEIINRGILQQQTSQIYMYTSFFKRERQYDPFKAKEIINRGILQQQTHVYLVL